MLFLKFLICCFNIVIFQAPKPEPPAVKAPKKTTAKAAPDEKKGKTAEVTKEEPLDPVAEKLRQQRLILSTSILNVFWVNIVHKKYEMPVKEKFTGHDNKLDYRRF